MAVLSLLREHRVRAAKRFQIEGSAAGNLAVARRPVGISEIGLPECEEDGLCEREQHVRGAGVHWLGVLPVCRGTYAV